RVVMKQAGEHTKLFSIRERTQKLLQGNLHTVNPAVFKKEINEILQQCDQYRLELEKQQEEIDELKEGKEQISRQRYAQLYDFSPTAFFRLSEKGEIVDLNRTAVQLLQKEREELIAADF